jgi:DNA-binding NtrC family response regulator
MQREEWVMGSNIWLISDGTPIFPEPARLLAQAGHWVTHAFYGREAFQALRQDIFHLIITPLSQDWPDKRPCLDAARGLD